MRIERLWRGWHLAFWVEQNNLMGQINQGKPESIADIRKDSTVLALQVSLHEPTLLWITKGVRSDPLKIELHYYDVSNNVIAVYHETLSAGDVILGIEADPMDHEQFMILIQRADESTLRKQFKGNYLDMPQALWEHTKRRGCAKML